MKNLLRLLLYIFIDIPISTLLLLTYIKLNRPCPTCETPDTPIGLLILAIYIIFNLTILYKIAKILFGSIRNISKDIKDILWGGFFILLISFILVLANLIFNNGKPF